MHIYMREDGAVTILALEGHLTIGEAESAVNEAVSRLIVTGRVKLVIDLEHVSVMDSSGLGTLVRTFNLTRSCQGRTVLVNPDRHVSAILQLSGMMSVFDIYEDETLAVRSFSPPEKKRLSGPVLRMPGEVGSSPEMPGGGRH